MNMPSIGGASRDRLRAAAVHLASDTDHAIKQVVREEPDGFRYTVNLADLKCNEAIIGVDCDGDMIATVCIDEASPDDSDFQRAVVQKLREAGWDSVEVRTEW